MNFPSTLTANPALNAIVSNVGSSHGVRLDGGSTGGVVEAFGDDANISLTVRGKGTGAVTIGNSSQTVTLGQGSALKGFFSTTVAWTHAAISSGQFGEIVIASSVCDIEPGDLVWVAAGVVAPAANVGYRQSTAATSRLTIVLANPGSTATSTLSGTARISWADLT
jgi:hypothetical protein